MRAAAESGASPTDGAGTPHRARRVLVVGIGSELGGRLAAALERNRQVEAIVGVDGREPRVELERVEFVRVAGPSARVDRLVRAAELDTVVVAGDPGGGGAGSATDLLGGVEALETIAAEGRGVGPVRRLVLRSGADYYGFEPDAPAFLTEEMRRTKPPRTARERSVVEAEVAMADLQLRMPDLEACVLRLVDVAGAESGRGLGRLLALPVIPAVAGFDPRLQLLDVEDAVRALERAALGTETGTFNVAADGVLALSEVASLLGKPLAPVLPPWDGGLVAAALRPLGAGWLSQLDRRLRYGCAVDNRAFKATGFSFRHTTREAVLALAEGLRTGAPEAALIGDDRYEPQIEEFLRRSPLVRRDSHS